MSAAIWDYESLGDKIPHAPGFAETIRIHHDRKIVEFQGQRRDGKRRRLYVACYVSSNGYMLHRFDVSRHHYKTAFKQLRDLMLLDALPPNWRPTINRTR